MTADTSTPSDPPPVPPRGASSHPADRQATTDVKQLKLLMVFHWVFTGLLAIGLLMVVLHYLLMGYIMDNPEMWNESPGGPPPEEFFEIFKYVYFVMGAVVLLSGISNALSARFIHARKYRTFSLIISGANCLMFPFGTVLGVFTFVVLLRDSVARVYAEAEG